MIHTAEGNLIKCDAEALVNTVNTVGIMGKGIALQFKMAFPENFKAYKRACDHGEVQLGKMFVFHTGNVVDNPKIIINFPTKGHWRSKTKIADVEAGLDDLVEVIKFHRITSIAVPPLGCGNGGLNWKDVRPLIVDALGDIDGLEVHLYAPMGAPDPEAMPVGTDRPAMTPGRAALLGLMRRYLRPGYDLSRLEVQKLAYFLQEAGQPLNLTFNRGPYGPYAETLNPVLQRLEGHYIRGYGDRSRDSVSSPIRLLDDPDGQVEEALATMPDTRARFDHVAELINGFETPYGLELLATAHWLAVHEPMGREDVETVIHGFEQWNDRKRLTFSRDHIAVAWDALDQTGWLGAPLRDVPMGPQVDLD
jgi:O-acetyl-ADP-ribose deacetylase (regulator of RNase III)